MDFKEKCRELGNKWWGLAEKVETQEQHQEFLEKIPKFPIEFCSDLSRCWTLNFEYYVEDFLAEIGFFVGIMGLKPKNYVEDYIMFQSPGNEFFFGFWQSDDKVPATPSGALRMLLWVKNPVEVGKILKERGAEFIEEMKPAQEGSTFYQGKVITPNGIVVHLWGDETMN